MMRLRPKRESQNDCRRRAWAKSQVRTAAVLWYLSNGQNLWSDAHVSRNGPVWDWHISSSWQDPTPTRNHRLQGRTHHTPNMVPLCEQKKSTSWAIRTP